MSGKSSAPKCTFGQSQIFGVKVPHIHKMVDMPWIPIPVNPKEIRSRRREMSSYHKRKRHLGPLAQIREENHEKGDADGFPVWHPFSFFHGQTETVILSTFNRVLFFFFLAETFLTSLKLKRMKRKNSVNFL